MIKRVHVNGVDDEYCSFFKDLWLF